MVAANKSNAVPEFEPAGNYISRITGKLGRVGLSICLRIPFNLYDVFAAGYSVGLCPYRLLGSPRAIVGSQRMVSVMPPTLGRVADRRREGHVGQELPGLVPSFGTSRASLEGCYSTESKWLKRQSCKKLLFWTPACAPMAAFGPSSALCTVHGCKP